MTIQPTSKTNTFHLSEDWAATAIAFLSILLIISGLYLHFPKLDWDNLSALSSQLTNLSNITSLFVVFLWTLSSAGIALILSGKSSTKTLGLFLVKLLLSFVSIFLITLLAQIITANQSVKNLGVEVVLLSLLIGLFISNIIGLGEWLKPAIQTELYIKIGLVILGSSIIFKDILQAGFWGILQSLVVVISVWYVSFWLNKLFKLDQELNLMLASAVSICGVSAAIATAGAIKGDSRKLSYVISLVLITAIPMMILMPFIAIWLELKPSVSGAWLGGTIDTTGAVVAAGTLLGEDALKYATIVKFSQNVLLGLAALLISIYWTYTQKGTTVEKPSLATIWARFPKFVLGFLLASLLFSLFLAPETIQLAKNLLKSLQTFWFGLAFTCIGLETKFTDIFSADKGKATLAFLIAQLFNILLTLAVAYWLFG
jgi:uncharacterized integral membrane protein (TIGR00698 family)